MTSKRIELSLNLLGDFLALSTTLILMYHFLGWGTPEGELIPSFSIIALPILASWMGWSFLFLFSGMYRRWIFISRSYHVFCLLRNFLLGGAFLVCMNLGPDLIKSILINQPYYIQTAWIKTLSLYLGLALTTTITTRLVIQWILRLFLRRGFGLDPMIIVSNDQSGDKIADKIANTWELGYKVIGFVGSSKSQKLTRSAPYLGDVNHLAHAIQEYKIAAVLISHESASQNDIVHVLSQVLDTSVQVLVIPDMYDVVSGHFKASFVHNLNFKELLPHNMPTWQAYLKRIIDIQIAIVLLIISSPILLFAILAIKLDSKGPVFYSQERIGQYGRPFKIWKFRTMRTDAEAAGPQWATKGDPRITKVGFFLRKTRIDEIPQFWCVLMGEMSIVGPRPERQHFIDQLKKEIPLYARRLVMKPGITGWAQVRHTYDTSVEDVRKKLMYDLYYFENMSILLDFQIMLRTVWVVLTGKGAQ